GLGPRDIQRGRRRELDRGHRGAGVERVAAQHHSGPVPRDATAPRARRGWLDAAGVSTLGRLPGAYRRARPSLELPRRELLPVAADSVVGRLSSRAQRGICSFNYRSLAALGMTSLISSRESRTPAAPFAGGSADR